MPKIRRKLLPLLFTAGCLIGAADSHADGTAAPPPPTPGAPAASAPAVTGSAAQPSARLAPAGSNPYAGVLARFDALLRTYRPSGRQLILRSPDSGRGATAELPATSERSDQLTRLLRERLASLTTGVRDLGSAPGGATGADAPDVLLTLRLRENPGNTPAPAGLSAGGLLELDLGLIDFAHATAIPAMQSSETLTIAAAAADGAIDFHLSGSGFRVRGSHAGEPEVQRVMVDTALVELLGRYLLVPYWRCIPGARPDPLVAQRIGVRFSGESPTERVQRMRAALRQYGFELGDGATLDQPVRAAIDALVVRFGFQPRSDYLDGGLFADIYLHVPLQARQQAALD